MTAAETLPAGLRAVLGPALRLPPSDVGIDNLRPLTRAPTRDTWAFDAVTPDERHPLILHTAPPGQPGVSFAMQARAQVAAAQRGVPVPRIVATDDSPAALGSPYLICTRIEGVTDHARIVGELDRLDPRGGRARLLRQCAHTLAAIHRIDAHTAEPARAQRLSICRRQLDTAGPASATFEWAFRWLTAHEPPPSPTVLVHGDYRMGNLLVDGGDLTGVIDWEWAHVGEPCEDLAWFCARTWRFGAAAALGAGGLGSVESFLGAYEEAGGAVVDAVAFHWWLVMATLFGGIVRRDQARAWLTGKESGMRLAVIGRRLCETEWDLLDLLARGGPAPPPREPAGAAAAWKDLLG